MEPQIQSARQLLVDYIVSEQTAFYRLAFRYVKNRDAALDVVQESIAKALSKIDLLREPAYLKTWFYRILINESTDYFRRNSRLVSWDETLADRSAPQGGELNERLDLYDAIDRLGEQERTIILLRFFEDLKLEDISRVTGTNLNTVKSRLYKALRKLRDMTGEDLADERDP